uniref:Uncharacterized protein n=1 Tax=viral metagenome TaxID=1070528 RepID=A0A6M3KFJ3_9ZZZZ
MTLSEKTKTTLTRTLEKDKDGLYPDRVATPTSAGVFPIRDTTATTWRHGDEIPTTTKDMNALFQWEHGDKVYGAQAKEHEGMKEYIKDINLAYGKESSYKSMYFDTFNLISEEKEKFNNL